MIHAIIRATDRLGLLALFIVLVTSVAVGQHTMPQDPAKPQAKPETPAVKSAETPPGATSAEAGDAAAGMGCMMARGQMRQNQTGMAMQGQGQAGQQAAARPGTGHSGFARAAQPAGPAALRATGPRRGPQAQDPRMIAHRDTVHGLLTNNERIRRSVVLLPDGIRSTTESDDPEVAALLKRHVPQMYQFVKEGKPVRKWDPLFNEIFKNADKIQMTVEETQKGVKVTETSKDEKVVVLIQEHSKIIDNFVATGWDSAHEEHPVPAKAKGEK